MSNHSSGVSRPESLTPSHVANREQGLQTPAIPPKYAPIPVWNGISGMGRTATYEALGRGDLRAINLNSRTLIDVEHGLAYLGSLPTAEITTGRWRNRDTAAGRLRAQKSPRQRLQAPTTA